MLTGGRSMSDKEKYEALKIYIEGLNNYYKNGSMCSMAESIHGESITEDILKYIKKIDNGEI